VKRLVCTSLPHKFSERINGTTSVPKYKMFLELKMNSQNVLYLGNGESMIYIYIYIYIYQFLSRRQMIDSTIDRQLCT
jgi:hypothetical protein